MESGGRWHMQQDPDRRPRPSRLHPGDARNLRPHVPRGRDGTGPMIPIPAGRPLQPSRDPTQPIPFLSLDRRRTSSSAPVLSTVRYGAHLPPSWPTTCILMHVSRPMNPCMLFAYDVRLFPVRFVLSSTCSISILKDVKRLLCDQ